jgi:sterol desaturase/sphingolipid hydroxylase (fatty acid hydroxylase superfamily)
MKKENVLEAAWYNWMPYSIAIILIALEIRRGCYSGQAMSTNDKLVNFISVFQDSIFIRPLVAYAGAALITLLAPSHAGTLADLPFWPTFIVVLLAQDFFHYWFHRWSHSNPVLWEMHRTHHSATRMTVAVTPRLNMMWELVIPANWLSAAMLYFGMHEVFWAWFGMRSIVNFASHSDVRWDLPLYENKILRPLTWVIERVITTPDAHHAHHGCGSNGAPMGNFAPTVIFWDVAFGTAHFPHQKQEKVGIADDPTYPWYRQLWWPVFRDTDS